MTSPNSTTSYRSQWLNEGQRAHCCARGLAQLTPLDQASRNIDLAKLTLNASQRDFSIEFTALDFLIPKNPLPVPSYWLRQRLDRNRCRSSPASYTSLWPGQYQLEVRATDRHGEWQEQGLRIPIRVQTSMVANLVVPRLPTNAVSHRRTSIPALA